MSQDTLDTFTVSAATHHLLRLTILLLLASLGLIAFIYARHALQPEPRFYTVSPSGEHTARRPLEQPTVSPKALLRWAAAAATNVNTLNFLNYRKTLENAREYFTQSGYDNFLSSLNDAHILDEIETKKLDSSAIVTGVPIILQEGVLQGNYAWEIQFPMLVTYQGASDKAVPQNKLVSMLVTRVSTHDAPKGIGIAQLISSNTNTLELNH